MLKRIHSNTLWVLLDSLMAGDMNMCNGCSRVESSGEVPGTECPPFELKVIADVLSSSQTSLCVLGAGVRTILSSSALEVLSLPRAVENGAHLSTGLIGSCPTLLLLSMQRGKTTMRVCLFSL